MMQMEIHFPSDEYVYTIKLREVINNKPHSYHGTITLIS